MIKLNCLSIEYPDKKIITNLSFTFNTGFNAICGPSGAGKTSIAHAILGLIPYTGKIESDSNRYAAVFQEDRLLDNLSVLKNLKLVCPNIEAVTSALTVFNMSENLHTKVKDLSGGMKRRVAILRAVLYEYDILILDEPFTGLDSEIKEVVMKYIKEKTSEKTVILISHDSSEVMYFDCKILHLDL